jgi:hypothetical protein
MTTSERLEQETEKTREQIAATLDELRARMTPGRVVDQLFDYANDSSGGMFFHNLRQQVVNNPLPVALMGAGLAWLAMANRNGPSRGASTIDRFGRRAQDVAARSADTAGEWAEQARGAAGDAAGAAAAAASDMSKQARQTGSGAADAASSAYAQAKDAASSSYDAAAETASTAYDKAAERTRAAAAQAKNAAGSVAETASAAYEATAEQMRRTGGKVSQSAAHMRDNVSGAGRNMMNFLNEQPLVLAGLGIAIGAVIGAALPSTEAEDEMMGQESDALKGQAAKFAGEQIDKGTAVAEHAWQGAKEESAKQGIIPNADDARAETGVQDAQAGPEAARFAQGATGAGEQATLVPSAGGESERPQSERKRDPAGT